NPQQSMFAGAISDLTLEDIMTFLDGGVETPPELSGVLDQIGIKGIPLNPLENATAQEQADLNNQVIPDALVGQFKTDGHDLPADKTQIIIYLQQNSLSNTVWYITDKETVNTYRVEYVSGTMKIEWQAQIYVVPFDTTIPPSFVFPKGYRVD